MYLAVSSSSYPLLDLFWTIFIFFLWAIWIWTLIMVFIDIFRTLTAASPKSGVPPTCGGSFGSAGENASEVGQLFEERGVAVLGSGGSSAYRPW